MELMVADEWLNLLTVFAHFGCEGARRSCKVEVQWILRKIVTAQLDHVILMPIDQPPHPLVHVEVCETAESAASVSPEKYHGDTADVRVKSVVG